MYIQSNIKYSSSKSESKILCGYPLTCNDNIITFPQITQNIPILPKIDSSIRNTKSPHNDSDIYNIYHNIKHTPRSV